MTEFIPPSEMQQLVLGSVALIGVAASIPSQKVTAS